MGSWQSGRLHLTVNQTLTARWFESITSHQIIWDSHCYADATQWSQDLEWGLIPQLIIWLVSSIGRAQHCHCWGKGIETPTSRQIDQCDAFETVLVFAECGHSIPNVVYGRFNSWVNILEQKVLCCSPYSNVAYRVTFLYEQVDVIYGFKSHCSKSNSG